MNKHLVEHHRFAIAPVIVLTVDVDVAAGIIRRIQAQVITVGTRVRIAMAHQLGARWQLGKHRRFDRADALHQFGGAWAQLHRRWMAVAVPLEVEALPASLEERVEADIVILIRALDLAGTQQILALLANLLPVRLQRAQIREIRRIQVRLVGNLRKQIKEAVDRREERRVVTQLPPQLVAHASTQVNVSNGDDINSGNDEFHGKGSHVKSEQTARVAT